MTFQTLQDIHSQKGKDEILQAIMDDANGFWLFLQSAGAQSDKEVELILKTLACACGYGGDHNTFIQVCFHLSLLETKVAFS